MPIPDVKDINQWVSELKVNDLYIPGKDNSMSARMLERSATNNNFNVKQARCYVALEFLLSMFEKDDADDIRKLIVLASDYTLTVGGLSRKDAITMEGKRVAGDMEQKKKKGILGMIGGIFGGNDSKGSGS